MIVIASLDEPIYYNLITKYWIPFIHYTNSKSNNLLKIYLLFGDTNIDHLNIPANNILKFSELSENLIPNLLKKTLLAFEYINNNYKYDKILRTNLSSFFIYDKLIEILDFLPSNNLYHGITTEYNNIIFVSGALFTMSNDIVNYILSNTNLIDFRLIDDVAIGVLLKDFPKTKGNRYDIVDILRLKNDVKINRHVNHLYKLNNHYHIRIKNSHGELRNIIDTKILDLLISKFYTDFYNYTKPI